MVSIMNDYVSNINLTTDDTTKYILDASLKNCDIIADSNIIMKGNRYIIDIKLKSYNIEQAVLVMNQLMEYSRFHYSSYFIRFNEGNMLRYRYATCKEDKIGFYCDVSIR